MFRYILHRVFIAIVQLFAVATIVFFLLRLMPGDPALLVLGTDNNPSPSVVAAMRHQLGLDLPIGVQYATWMKGLIHLNFGQSIFYSEPVSKLIMTRFPNTIELALVSMVVAIIIGVLAGIVAAMWRGSKTDILLTSATTLGISTPVYVLGTVLVLVFAIQLTLFPAGGDIGITQSFVGHVRSITLPALTLACGLSASIARQTRSSMLEVFSQEYIQTVRAKGLGEWGVVIRHVFRNSLIPVVTVIGLQLGNLMGGTVLVEAVFNWPGLSSLLVNAIGHRDYPLIQGCILVIATLFILINLIVDLTYGALDPRIRSER